METIDITPSWNTCAHIALAHLESSHRINTDPVHRDENRIEGERIIFEMADKLDRIVARLKSHLPE